jgi:chromosome segregation ATPase
MRQIDEAERADAIDIDSIETELADGKLIDSRPVRNRSSAKETEYETSTALVGERCLPTIRIQASPFLDTLNTLKSVSERVCDEADRQAESTEPMEQNQKADLVSLRLQLKEESLRARGVALRELEEAWRAKIELIQNQVRAREAQLRVRESNLARLTTKVYGVISRINQAEAESQHRMEQLETEITELRHQLKVRDERLAAKQATPELAETLSADIKELEHRLQTAEEKLQSCEAELKTKENLIQAAGAKEAELGKLITRLSSECDKLASELRDKSPVAAQSEKKPQRSRTDSPVWKKIVGRIQEEPV